MENASLENKFNINLIFHQFSILFKIHTFFFRSHFFFEIQDLSTSLKNVVISFNYIGQFTLETRNI